MTNILFKTLKSWKNGIFNPEKAMESGLSSLQKMAVVFLLGCIYTTFEYFVDCGKGTTLIKALPTRVFYVHSLFGGFAIWFEFIFCITTAYLGLKLIGRPMNYLKIENLIFSVTFLYTLVLISLYALGLRIISLTSYFGFSASIIPVFVIGMVLAYRLLRQAIKLPILASIGISLTVPLICYFIPKFAWSYSSVLIEPITGGMPFELKLAYGIVFFSLIGGICYALRASAIKKEAAKTDEK